jgi:hypothetical protein
VKTHFWDDSLLDRAAKYNRVANADLCYLVDETAAAIDTAPYRKIPFCVGEFADLGLAAVDDLGRGVVWENGDYPLYVAYLRLPTYNFYWMIEYDVLINFEDYNSFFRNFEKIDLDLIGTLNRGGSAWQWYAPAARMFAEVWAMFFPMMRLSNRAVAYALSRRLIRSHQYRGAAPADRVWPHCEAWLPSELCGHGAFACADINSLGTTYYQFLNEYGSRPHLLQDLENRAADRRIYHPVLTGRDYVEKAYYWHVVRNDGADAAEVDDFLAAVDRLQQPDLAATVRSQLAWKQEYRRLAFGPARLDVETLLGCDWRFWRADGTLIAVAMSFAAAGTIAGYAHRNEHRWAIEDGRLLLFAEDGGVTTVFDEAVRSTDGRLLLRGGYVPSPSVVHVLEENPRDAAAGPTVGEAH